MKQRNFLVIGAGSRGTAYARAITNSTPARIGAVAEPNPYKRRTLGQNHIWGKRVPKTGEEFAGWEEWIEYETKRRAGRSSKSKQDQDKDSHNEEEVEGVDGILICTLDETHITILTAIASANLLDLHVLCEKPLALSLDDCLRVYAAYNAGSPRSIFSIGHVLRYSPHNLLLRRLVRAERVIGDIVSVEHTEPVGYWHFAHSYVRGNWRRETDGGDGSLLTKSCHDIDFLVWLIEAPVVSSTSDGDSNGSSSAGRDGESERTLKLRTISSTGYLTQFTPSQKPPAAGSATNCTSCPIERECVYSAIRIYRDNQLRKGETGWPVQIVCPDIEDYLPNHSHNGTQSLEAKDATTTAAAESHLLSVLSQDYTEATDDSSIKKRPWYGRCVYESDNDVVDDQVVSLSWDVVPSKSTSSNTNNRKTNPKTKPPGVTALFHMIAPTQAQCVRRGRIYGTAGEITYDSSSISIFSFSTGETRTIHVPKQPPEEEESHGGGDYGLARGFVGAVDAVVNRGWSVEQAQREFVGCSLEGAVKSHGVVFAAEESRRSEAVVRWEGWWDGKLRGVGLGV
ncbi:hypothetical protein BJX76DRAFT_366761 [Aspergillus varians]